MIRTGAPALRIGSGIGAWALACALALPVAAETTGAPCPTKADLEAGGIQLTRLVPQFTEAFRYENGVLVGYRAEDPSLGNPPRRETYLSPLLVSRQQMGGREFRLDYAADPAGLTELPQTGVWTSDATLHIDGEAKAQGTVTLQYRGTRDLTIGACRYSVWQVSERIEMGKLRTAFLKEYAPDPGLVLRVTRLDPDTGKPVSDVAFDRIEARKPSARPAAPDAPN